ncbi:MAG TPA: alpha/beta hydrolase [Nevskiaceae bacterium]|nr:alpha/beta hydrolase [Nevskiaceae bacterium]
MTDISSALGPVSSGTLQPHYIHANGLEFAYLEALPEGDISHEAPLVLCLHGFPDTAWSFSDLLPRLAAAGYRAIALFMRGYAPSALAGNGQYAAVDLGRDVVALFEHFGVARGYIVGHDWGGVAAYAAAAMRPDRVAGIVVAGVPHPRRLLLRPARQQMKASHYIFGFQMPKLPERRMARDDFAWLRALVHSWSPQWEIEPAYWQQVTTAFATVARRRAALAYYRDLPKALFRGDTWRFMMRPVQVPARVVCGAEDRCMLPDSFARQAHLFAGGYELVQLPGAGHFMHLEAPDAFAREVLSGLRQAAASAERRA